MARTTSGVRALGAGLLMLALLSFLSTLAVARYYSEEGLG